MILSLAVRMFFALRGHRLTDRPLEENLAQPLSNSHMPSLNTSHYRNLFWLCYGMNKLLSLHGSHIPLIVDETCDLDLPPTFIAEASSLQFVNGGREIPQSVLLFPFDLRLALLKVKNIWAIVFTEFIYNFRCRTPQAHLDTGWTSGSLAVKATFRVSTTCSSCRVKSTASRSSNSRRRDLSWLLPVHFQDPPGEPRSSEDGVRL
jgi:hypothetical protein